MAKGGLFGHFKKRVEELRIASLTPEEVMVEQTKSASDRVTKAHNQLEALKRELQQMDEKYHLSWNAWGVPSAGFGNWESAAEVATWWKSYAARTYTATQEFNESLMIFARLKGAH